MEGRRPGCSSNVDILPTLRDAQTSQAWRETRWPLPYASPDIGDVLALVVDLDWLRDGSRR
eukprot:3155336-Prymnesium_polylepis.1